VNLDPARHGTLKRAHDIALGLTHNLARSRARSIADLCDTAYAYTSTPALARARELAHGLAYELVYDLAHDRDPVCTLERVRKQVHELEQCLQGIVSLIGNPN